MCLRKLTVITWQFRNSCNWTILGFLEADSDQWWRHSSFRDVRDFVGNDDKRRSDVDSNVYDDNSKKLDRFTKGKRINPCIKQVRFKELSHSVEILTRSPAAYFWQTLHYKNAKLVVIFLIENIETNLNHSISFSYLHTHSLICNKKYCNLF